MEHGDKRDWLKTKSFLQSMQMGAGGWDVSIQDRELTQVPSIWLYVFDEDSSWCWTAAVGRDSFGEYLAKSRAASPGEWQNIRDGLGTVIAGLNGRPCGADPQRERELAMLLALYAGTTKTIETIKDGRDGGHFVVMNYGGHGAGSMLRPFALTGDDPTPVPYERLLEVVDAVVTMDRQSHPEWFCPSGSTKSSRNRPG